MLQRFRNFITMGLSSSHTVKKALITLFIALSIMPCLVNPVFSHDEEDTLMPYIALLNGGQEVPPNESESFGVAFMVFNLETDILCYSITFTGFVDGVETAAHFHGPAAPGESAGIVFTIDQVPSNVKNGCVGPLTKEQANQLCEGLFYINIHSEKFPAGEIRGQVLPFQHRLKYIVPTNKDDF